MNEGVPSASNASSGARDVFVSYTAHDEPWAIWIAGVLEDAGYTVFIQAWDIRPGMNFGVEMQKATRDSKRTLLVLSPTYLDSKSGTAEWVAAFAQDPTGEDAKVLPVRVAECAPPGLLRPVVYIDLHDRDEAGARQALLAGIEPGRAKRKGQFPGARGTAEKGPRSAVRPFPGSLPAIWTVPFPPNRYFKGRQEELQGLRERLCSRKGSAAPLPEVIHGLGGVGKTQLAVQYAWQERAQYNAVLWVEGDTPASLHANLAALAAKLELDRAVASATEEATRLEGVLDWMKTHRRWLLILDNVDTREAAAAAASLLQRAGWGNVLLGSGHVLVTSRRSDWDLSFQAGELGLLTPQQALDFLLERTPASIWPTPLDERSRDAAQVAKELGFLPLALEQAAAYLTKLRIRATDYLDRLGKARASLLRYPTSGGTGLDGKRMAVASTWQVTQAALDAPARTILRILAFLAPEEVPRDLFSRAPKAFQEAFDKMAAEATPQAQLLDHESITDHGLGELAEYSLVQLSPNALSCHRIVMAVEHDLLDPKLAQDWLGIVVRLLWEAAPAPDDYTQWGTWQALRPHVAAIVIESDRSAIVGPITLLMGDFASYLEQQALWAEAEPLMRRALAIAERHFGSHNPGVAIHLNNLAHLLSNTNRTSEAEPLMRRALAIDEQHFGPRHHSVAINLNNLAQLLSDTNRKSEAEPLLRRALDIDEKSLGPSHPNVGISLNNLAQLLSDTNRKSEAEPLLRRALDIHEKSWGPRHPKIAVILNNLAQLLSDTNRKSQTEPLMRRALDIMEQRLGPHHPDVSVILNNLAQLLSDTNRKSEAEPLLRRALDIDERSLGPHHPAVAIRLSNLAQILGDTDRTSEAEPLIRRALDIDERSLGPHHPAVAIRLSNLAQILGDTDRTSEAEPLIRRALDIGEQSLGPEHPSIAIRLSNLALLLHSTNRSSEAEPLLRRALDIDERSFGAEHPEVATDLANLAWLLWETYQSSEAEPMLRRALRIFEDSLGSAHPKTLQTKRYLQKLGDLARPANK